MKNNLVLIAAVMGLFASTIASATEVSLFNVTSDVFPGKTLKVSLDVDANSDVTGLSYDLTSDSTFPLSQFASGIVLYQADGKDAVTVKSKDFNAATGGTLVLTYLESGISNTYGTFNFSIGRQGQNWDAYVTNSKGVPTSFISMFLAKNTFLGQTVGISSISVK